MYNFFEKLREKPGKTNFSYAEVSHMSLMIFSPHIYIPLFSISPYVCLDYLNSFFTTDEDICRIYT